jgi:hypothetical protein
MPFTDDELQFLRWHRLNESDIYDGRHQSKASREAAAKRDGKYLVLTSVRCRAAGHRIRTRAGHCFQCDPLKLVYQIRHSKSAYVYIAGSLSGRLIKIGSSRDIPQREGKLRYDQYAGFDDWCVLFSGWAEEAGRLESDASTRVAGRRIYKRYFKDGVEQVAVEAFQCSFSAALKAIKDSLGSDDKITPWVSKWSYRYEFDHDTHG